MLYDIKLTGEALKAAADWAQQGYGIAPVELLVDDRMLLVGQGDDLAAFDTDGSPGSDEYLAVAPLDREPESIHDLFAKVKAHPDFAGGTVFVRDDVIAALHDEDGCLDEDEAARMAESLTFDQLAQSEKVIESFIFNGVYTWADAIRDNVTP